MRVKQCIGCKDFPCTDVRHDCYVLPDVEIQPDRIKIVLISEAAPAGSTYKLRGPAYYFRGQRAFPSYLQAGPSFFIEKSKRQMIAEDIAAALRLIG